MWILSARLASREQRWTARMAMGSPALLRRPKERQETDVKKETGVELSEGKTNVETDGRKVGHVKLYIVHAKERNHEKKKTQT
jgi:hypothetical protein